MGLESILDIASTGMSAQSVRLNTTASNLANANTVGGTPETTYRAKQPIFNAVMLGQNKFGVGQQAVRGINVSEVIDSQVALERSYQPGHPSASKDGFVYSTNVNSVEEMANMISASRDYQMNVEIMNTTKNLMLRTINLLERS